MSWLQTCAKRLARTPLHPQWLMLAKRPPATLVGFGGSILDIGSADCWLRPYLATTAQYVGLDYPATGKLLCGARPDVFADAAHLPFSKETFDAVACLEVLEHGRAPDVVLLEIARMLRPGAVAHLSMPFLYSIHDAPHDYQRWTRYGWRRSAEDAGLRIASLSPIGNSLHAAGVLVCLALAGRPLQRAGRWKVLWLPVLGALTLVTNVVFMVLAKCWPSWDAMASGYELEMHKT